jgi:hypothetical protein
MGPDELEEILQFGNAIRKERAALRIQSDPRLGSKPRIKALRMLLQDPSWHVRRAAALALIACLGRDAKGLVEHLAKDRAYGVRQDVTAALAQLEDRKEA